MKRQNTWQFVKGKAHTLYKRTKGMAQTFDLGLRVAKQFLPLVEATNPALGNDLRRGYDS